MRKILFPTALFALCLSFSSFTINSNDDFESCAQYARRVGMAEMNAYYGDSWPIREWRDSQRYWESYCDGAGGADGLLDPVFLSTTLEP